MVVHCEQPDGTRVAVEDWEFLSFIRGEPTAPEATRAICSAVRCVDCHGRDLTPCKEALR